MGTDGLGPARFEDVLRLELEQVRPRRETGLAEESDIFKKAAKAQLFGLAFSGGGIRSATFNLGILQGLARLGLLQKVDYLSTVSGGGYIGSWLVAWIHRTGLKFEAVFEALNPEHAAEDSKSNSKQKSDPIPETEPNEIHWLRKYSNYLTPRLGLFSGDTWAMLGTYARNLLLNQSLLLLLLSALLLAALFPVSAFRWLMAGSGRTLEHLLLGFLFFGLTFMAASIAAVMEGDENFRMGPVSVSVLVIVPTLLGLWLLWPWWMREQASASLGSSVGLVAISLTGLWAAAWSAGVLMYKWMWRCESEGLLRKALRKLAAIVILALIAGALGGSLLYWTASKVASLQTSGHEWHVEFLGIPVVLVIFLVTMTLHIGLLGRVFDEGAREWWARLGGLMCLWTLVWSTLSIIAVYGPEFMSWLYDLGGNTGWERLGINLVQWGVPALWAAITGTGVLGGRSPQSDHSTKRSLSFVMAIAPVVFILGLLLLLSVAIERFAGPLAEAVPKWIPACLAAVPPQSTDAYWKQVELISGTSAILCVAAFALAFLLSLCVGVNEFSMHGFYRNRLVRCYLGASRGKDRRAHPFTGFDPKDDFRLDELVPKTKEEAPAAEKPQSPPPKGLAFLEWVKTQWKKMPGMTPGQSSPVEQPQGFLGPYPIFNTAINLVGGKELAWQQRKAASFMMTPLFCGYDLPEFRNDPTVKPFQPTSNREIYLGLAMATSGAAASPNMGYHSSPPLAFLMTMFNVRLGWWLGNTRNAKDWERGGPRIGLACLLSELLGRTHNKQRNIYLSDGGHFENLGIYELVRRRCRFIIACDAGQDPEMKFGDLGNAIEKCRTDFGVDIEIDIEPIRHDGEGGRSRWHCAVGTIHYDRLDSTLPEGTILYLKSSLTGDEPTDVQRYAAEQPLFPHQSTADQWFTESQFESYRMLGQHIAERVIEAATDGEEVRRKSAGETFAALRQHWYPPARAAEGSFTKHTETYARLLETMRATPSLAFLDRQVYPEWEALVKGASAMRSDSAQTTLWLPATEEERRAGFYFCGQVIQLMEDAYIDLDLEAEFDHPDNRGWKNLFRHWSWSGMFCATWAVSAGIYGARFQRFCERQLDLHVGNEIEFVGPFPAEDESLAQAHENDFLNFWEVALIKEFRTQCQAQQEGASGLSVIPLRIVVKTIGQPDSKSVSKDMKFTFGFVLGRVSGADSAKKLEIVYMRVQNHLRTMGFAKRGLHKLMSSYGVRNVLNNVTPCGSDARRKELLDAEQLSLLEALPSQKDCAAFTLLFEEVEKEEQFLADREAALRKRKPK